MRRGATWARRGGSMAVWTRAGVSMAPAAAHDLMPAPVRLEWQPGQLVVDRRFTLGSVGTADPRIDAALARARQRLGSLGVTVAPGPSGAKATLVVEATGPGKAIQEVGEDESYELTVGPKQARLTAPNPLGVLR